MIRCKLEQLADMLEAQIRLLASAGHLEEAAIARREVTSLRLLAGISD